MATLSLDERAVRELRRQCLHHNIFPIFLGRCLDADPPNVHRALKPLFDQAVEQLSLMSLEEVTAVVDSLSFGYREFLQPIDVLLAPRFLERVAEYCLVAELQKAYSPVASVLEAEPAKSEVLSACPELLSLFDDDGLLRMDGRFEMHDGGIKYGEFLLHYHQFLRRGFSSNPNFDFLGELCRYQSRHPENDVRVAIDHRRIMLFEHYRQFVERDTWFGPAFDGGRLDDPSYVGLTVVARVYPSSLDSHQITQTEFLWKANEGELLKTLEIEEISSASELHDNWHINRYLHAQRDMSARCFGHVDGAAKVYAQNEYPVRLKQRMPKQAKATYYLKLFRIDGRIATGDWLSLVSMFYKGNEMVLEYFDRARFERLVRPQRESLHNALLK